MLILIRSNNYKLINNYYDISNLSPVRFKVDIYLDSIKKSYNNIDTIDLNKHHYKISNN